MPGKVVKDKTGWCCYCQTQLLHIKRFTRDLRRATFHWPCLPECNACSAHTEVITGLKKNDLMTEIPSATSKFTAWICSGLGSKYFTWCLIHKIRRRSSECQTNGDVWSAGVRRWTRGTSAANPSNQTAGDSRPHDRHRALCWQTTMRARRTRAASGLRRCSSHYWAAGPQSVLSKFKI